MGQTPIPLPGTNGAGAADIKSADSIKPELSAEQKLAFQTALKDFYLRVAVTNNLQVQVLKAQATQDQAQKAIAAACPGTVVGLESDKAECKLPEPKKPDPPTSK
jgi:hypothetical protein